MIDINSEKIPKRFVNEKLGEHWCVDETQKSFEKLMNHLKNNTNMYKFFIKASENIFKVLKKDNLIIADIGGGIGWTGCILAQSPQVKKVYVVEPSKERLSKGPFVSKHFNLPSSKIKFLEGTFDNFNLPEKVDLIMLHGAFHHCFDKDTEVLFNSIKKNLAEKTNKVLISGEHYLNPLVMIKRFIRYYSSFLLFKKKQYDFNSNPIGPGNWNAPDYFGGEHNRLKTDIKKIFKENGFVAKYYSFDEDNLKKKYFFKWMQPLIYYYAILHRQEN